MASSGVGRLKHNDWLMILVCWVVGSTQMRMLLPHWFGSEWAAHGLGRGVSRVDSLSWLLSAPAGSMEAGDELILCLSYFLAIGRGGRDDCC